MFSVVVRKYIEVGIRKVRFTGTYDECVDWMCSHRWGYYDVLNPEGRMCSYMLREPK